MTIVPPSPGEPRRPHGPRDSGDAWVEAPTGQRYWGRYGAAGLLAYDAQRGVLLQHRVAWSHFGDTWALPGGALHAGESARDGAIREAQEEAGVPDGSVRARFESVLDLGVWSYTTVVADVVVPFEPVISDPESVALEWVPVDEVAERPLHPGFGAAWPGLKALLPVRPVVVVDAANVVGSVPDGWWKDRAGATARLRDRLDAWARGGVAADRLGLGSTRWHPQVMLVVEGAARGVADGGDGAGIAAGGAAGVVAGVVVAAASAAASIVSVAPSVQIVRAPGSGDDAIVQVAAERASRGDRVCVVTSDRGLRERILALAGGAEGQQSTVEVRSVRWLRDQLDSAEV